MTQQRPPEQEGFSVVIPGAMNPALHRPGWYNYAGMLSEEEEADALQGEFVFVPTFAQFATHGLTFRCDPERWQLSVDSWAKAERACDIAATTFDDRLKETPIRAVGLNFDSHRFAGCESVAKRLSELVAELPFGFEKTPESSATVSFTSPMENGRLRCKIEPSGRDRRLVYLAYNAHFEFRPTEPNKIESVDLRGLLGAALVDVRPLVDRGIQNILTTLQS